MEKETTSHDLRVGWSTNSASLMLGEDPNSWCYSSCEGKMASDKKFEDYGEKFTKGDVVGAFIDFSQNEINVTFTKNGEDQGDAFQISKEELGDDALLHSGELYKVLRARGDPCVAVGRMTWTVVQQPQLELVVGHLQALPCRGLAT